MINNEKIGVGIITFNRPFGLEKCFKSLNNYEIADHIIIVNDGDKLNNPNYEYLDKFIQHDTNLGVAKSKNEALKYLVDKECDHIFLIEDDIFIKDILVFEKYIEASKKTGIQHFNYSQHGMMNKTFDGHSTPNPRTIIDYGSVKVSLYPHCVGAFSYYSKACLDKVGFIDENYFNACEHVDHTLEIIKEGMHPPFWYFADIEESWKYLGDEEWSLQQSTISSKDNHKEVVTLADRVFQAKHGCLPGQIPLTYEDGVIKSIKEIKKTYATI